MLNGKILVGYFMFCSGLQEPVSSRSIGSQIRSVKSTKAPNRSNPEPSCYPSTAVYGVDDVTVSTGDSSQYDAESWVAEYIPVSIKDLATGFHRSVVYAEQLIMKSPISSGTTPCGITVPVGTSC